MPDELTKKAVEMLLKGATLLGEPCPYCKGVRVMKDGHALCVNCGREPEPKHSVQLEAAEDKKEMDESKPSSPVTTSTTTADAAAATDEPIKILERKLEELSRELEKETDHEKQQSILKSINSLMDTIERFKKQ